MATVYVSLIINGMKTYADVPNIQPLKDDVKRQLIGLGLSDLVK